MNMFCHEQRRLLYRKFSCEMAIGKIETQEFVSLRDTRKVLQKTFQEWFLFLQGDTENEFGEPIWLGRIYPNMVNDEFQKEPLWETDKRIKLDGIRLYCGDIGLEIEWCSAMNKGDFYTGNSLVKWPLAK